MACLHRQSSRRGGKRETERETWVFPGASFCVSGRQSAFSCSLGQMHMDSFVLDGWAVAKILSFPLPLSLGACSFMHVPSRMGAVSCTGIGSEAGPSGLLLHLCVSDLLSEMGGLKGTETY